MSSPANWLMLTPPPGCGATAAPATGAAATGAAALPSNSTMPREPGWSAATTASPAATSEALCGISLSPNTDGARCSKTGKKLLKWRQGPTALLWGLPAAGGTRNFPRGSTPRAEPPNRSRLRWCSSPQVRLDLSARCRLVAAGVQLGPLRVGVGLRRKLGVRRVGCCATVPGPSPEVDRCAEERVRDPHVERLSAAGRALTREPACTQEKKSCCQCRHARPRSVLRSSGEGCCWLQLLASKLQQR